MSQHRVVVEWAGATDPEMGRVIRRGVTTRFPQNGHAVHVVAHGLPSTQWLHDQFGVMGAQSRIGRTRTLPGPRDRVERRRFAVANRQNDQQRFYTICYCERSTPGQVLAILEKT